MITITLTHDEIRALLHIVSFNDRMRNVSDKALLPQAGEETAFDKLLMAGDAAGINVCSYT